MDTNRAQRTKTHRWSSAVQIFVIIFATTASYFGFVVFAVIGPVLAQIARWPTPSAPSAERGFDWSVAAVVAIGALIISGIGTASTVILGWRNERRQSAEFKLKIEALELQLAEMRRKQAGRPEEA